MRYESSFAHWMDIGIEEQWQKEFSTPLPSLPTPYDTKVFDTERLAVFWGAPEDVVLLRKKPPQEWVEHLRKNGIGVPTVLALELESRQFGSEHLQALLPYLAQKRPQPKLLPYVVTEAGWELRARADAVLEGCVPGFTKQVSNKAVQREVLAEAGIPTPVFNVFESYTGLARFLSTWGRRDGRAYVLKYPYGASGLGMFVLDTPEKAQYMQRRLERLREPDRKTVLILEEWHRVKSHVSYQLTLQRDGTVSFDFLRQQILSDGVFKGLRFTTDLGSDEKTRLRELGMHLGRTLAARGAGAIINVDAIVTCDGTIYPAIDINVRFSLSTYFSRYVAACAPERHIKVQYYDMPGVTDISALLRATEHLASAGDVRAVVASISDRCSRGLRRIFMLFEANSHANADVLEQRWISAVSHKENRCHSSVEEAALALNGGERIRAAEWPTYDKGHVDLSDGDETAALRAIRSRRLFRYDNRPHGQTEVGQLEQELAEFFGSPYVLACSSGTTALALALLGVGIRRGDAVACPAFTFAATPSAIILAGATPVMVEVDENLHMDPADLKAKLTSEVKAVMAVHMRGFGCDIERLVGIADVHGIPLIEDAVPALGVGVGRRKLGTFGRAGAFSTQSDKCINTGEGGFLLTSDRTVFERAVVLSGAYEQRLRRHTEPSLPVLSDLTLPIFSFRMDEIRGAMARHQLAGLERRVATFQGNYRYVASRLADLEPIRLRQATAENAFLGESLIFRLVGATAQQVSWFVQAINAEGIEARGLGDDARPNIRCFWNWRFAFPESTLDETINRYRTSATFLKEAIDVPMSITLTKSDCEDVVAAITKVCNAYSRCSGSRRLGRE